MAFASRRVGQKICTHICPWQIVWKGDSVQVAGREVWVAGREVWVIWQRSRWAGAVEEGGGGGEAEAGGQVISGL